MSDEERMDTVRHLKKANRAMMNDLDCKLAFIGDRKLMLSMKHLVDSVADNERRIHLIEAQMAVEGE